jgi:serine/threonine-protein kinase
MPPEQILGAASIDRRADLFALGVMLWEAVARRRMWEGKSEVELFRALATGVLPNLREFAPGTPESILSIVRQATAIAPEHRFANALDMLAAIEEASTKEGLVTRPHELAAFMAAHFGEARNEEQLQIKAALRGELGSGALEPTGSRQRLIPGSLSEPARMTAEPMELQELQSSRTFRVQQRGWGLTAGLAVAAALVLVGTAALRRSPASSASVTETARPKTILFEVQALPPGAEILLDGKLLGTDHFSGSEPVTERKVSLEVRASGHVTERKEIALTRDMSVQIVLAPDPAAADARASVPTAAADSSPTSAPARAQVNPRTTNKSASTSRNRSAKCNPPYVFAADGVKTYKPECF